MIRETLWSLAAQLQEIWATMVETGGTLEPDTEARLDALTGDFGEKLEQCRRFRATLEANAAAHKAEADRLAARHRAMTRAAEELRLYMARKIMIAVPADKKGKHTFELPDGSARFTASWTKGRTEVTDRDYIPESCLIQREPDIDLAKVRILYDRGLIFDGVKVTPQPTLKEA